MNVDKALELVEALARCTTPEEEFELLEDGTEYEDVDEYVADLGDDRLFGEYGTFMDFVRSAKEIVK